MKNIADQSKKKLKLNFKKEPQNWKEIWNGIKNLRESFKAPVDVLGCSELVQNYDKKSKNEKAYHQLIGLMLSAQTKDEVTHSTLRFLVEQKNLSIDTIINTKEEDLNEWISAVGFHNKKAIYIKKATQMINDKFQGIVPDNLKDLSELPGVGPKMSHLLLQHSFGKVEGISVDTHVHRISNRLQWVKQETKNPDQTMKELEDWLPEDKWQEINHLLVGFGQTICKPIAPRCWDCPVKDLCPYTAKNLEPDKNSKSKPRISDHVQKFMDNAVQKQLFSQTSTEKNELTNQNDKEQVQIEENKQEELQFSNLRYERYLKRRKK